MLNISPINFIKTNNILKAKPAFVKTRPAADVFVKSANRINFKGNEQTEQNDFITWANATNFIKNDLENVLKDPKYKIGSGFSHTAYEIPNCENYVIRSSNSVPLDEFLFQEATIKDTEDKNLDVNIGQQIAIIELPHKSSIFNNRVEVLKKQTGESLGVKNSQTIGPNEPPYEAEERMQKYERTLSDVANMPLESYEKLLRDFTKAAKAGYRFDHLNSNNLLVDTENQSINMIDMDRGSSTPNYGNLLYALTDSHYFGTYSASYGCECHRTRTNDEIFNMLEVQSQIINKFLTAMGNLDLKFNKEDTNLEFFNFLNSFPCQYALKTRGVEGIWAKLEQMDLVK